MISNTDNTIDSQDLRAAINEQKELIHGLSLAEDWTDEIDNLKQLEGVMEAARGNAGDPESFLLIADDHFRDWAEDHANGLGQTDGWPYTHINWDTAAEALKMDYGQVDFEGNTYWVRC